MRKLLKLATLYVRAVEGLTVQGVLNDLAIRTIFSMIPFADLDAEDQKDLKIELALSHVVPGAKRLVQAQTGATIARDKEEKQLVREGRYREVLDRHRKNLHNKMHYFVMMVEVLCRIDDLCKEIERNPTLPLIDDLVVNLNLADDIIHTDTGFLMGLVYELSESFPPPHGRLQSLRVLMDAKNLRNIGDTVYMLYPYVKSIGDKSITTLMSQLRRKYPHSGPENIEKELHDLSALWTASNCFMRHSYIDEFLGSLKEFYSEVQSNPEGPWSAKSIRRQTGLLNFAKTIELFRSSLEEGHGLIPGLTELAEIDDSDMRGLDNQLQAVKKSIADFGDPIIKEALPEFLEVLSYASNLMYYIMDVVSARIGSRSLTGFYKSF